MRIYQPQNEFGSSLISDGNLVTTQMSLEKTLSDGAVTVTTDDVETLSDCYVVETIATIDGENVVFYPEVTTTDTAITI